MSPTPDAIIIGAGLSGVAMAYSLRHKLGLYNFTVYEKMDGVGGTWRSNVYPGCGCDLPSHLYSFSFNPNPDWTKPMCDQWEILQYIEDTVDKFALRQHFRTSTECVGAEWCSSIGKWKIHLRDTRSSIEFHRLASVFVSATGAFSAPREIEFMGMGTFKGPVVHTARWDRSVSWQGKRVAVIGNGCSAVQVVPAMAQKAAYLKQYARSAQWYHPRPFPNVPTTATSKWALRFVPFWQRFLRLAIFLYADSATAAYFPTPEGKRLREREEREASKYIRSEAPEKYRDFIIPSFALGCKRRIFDPGYLEVLHQPHVHLLNHGIERMTESGIVSDGGDVDNFDLIVLATGFKVTEFLSSLHIVGVQGKTLQRQWNESRGAQAYMGTFVHNFPNMAILFGPNTFPANNSVLFSIETQIEYVVKTLFQPLMDGRARVVEVTGLAEETATRQVDQELAAAVFAGGCSNWYVGQHGRNVASWPGSARSFWAATYFPNWKAFEMHGGSPWWRAMAARRKVMELSRKFASVSWRGGLAVVAVAYVAVLLLSMRMMRN